MDLKILILEFWLWNGKVNSLFFQNIKDFDIFSYSMVLEISLSKNICSNVLIFQNLSLWNKFVWS